MLTSLAFDNPSGGDGIGSAGGPRWSRGGWSGRGGRGYRRGWGRWWRQGGGNGFKRIILLKDTSTSDGKHYDKRRHEKQLEQAKWLQIMVCLHGRHHPQILLKMKRKWQQQLSSCLQQYHLDRCGLFVWLIQNVACSAEEYEYCVLFSWKNFFLLLKLFIECEIK